MPRHHLPLITVDDVSKTYGEHPEDYSQLVLVNIRLKVEDGEFVIIFGPSGSGKSTLLNLMAGLEFPSAGRVFLRNKNLAHLDNEALARYHRRRMGMVFQSFNLIKSLNVWENVALPQAADGVPYHRRHRRALHLLKLLGIGDFADRHPNELSGGQQQRVAIARALINNPDILLVDEPTGNLDTKTADEVMHLLHDLHARARHTIVLVTHNPDYLRFATRVVHVRDGHVLKEEAVGEGRTELPPLLPQEYYEQLISLKGA